MVRALYPGSFDPHTRGHLDLVHRALRLFEGVTVAVARNLGKAPVFSVEERVAMLRQDLPDDDRIEVVDFDGLVTDFAHRRGFAALIRGVRTASDFEYELQMGMMNRRLDETVETVLLVPSVEFSFVSSSLIKEILIGGGDASPYLTPRVEHALRERLQDRPPRAP